MTSEHFVECVLGLERSMVDKGTSYPMHNYLIIVPTADLYLRQGLG